MAKGAHARRKKTKLSSPDLSVMRQARDFRLQIAFARLCGAHSSHGLFARPFGLGSCRDLVSDCVAG